MDDFVFTAYLLPRTPRNEELYERPWNGKKPHYVVLEQLLGVVDTSCAKLSLLMHISMGITREDYESKSLRYKIYQMCIRDRPWTVWVWGTTPRRR